MLLLSLLLARVLLSGDSVPVTASRVACVVRTVSVMCVTHVPHVMVAVLFLLLVFVKFVLVDPNTCIVGDQGHDFVRSAQGFLSRNGLLFVSTYRRRGN